MPYVKVAAVVIGVLFGAGSVAAESPGRESGKASGFLDRLTGEWSGVAVAVLGPGQEPRRIESREVARLLGGRWLVIETTHLLGGRSRTSIFTIGYDAVREGFVGTYVDEGQAHLWFYTGDLDDTGSVLTLDTEGPIFGDPTTTTKYRVVIEIEGVGHRVMRSSILGPDGEWFEFARAETRRNDGASSEGGER